MYLTTVDRKEIISDLKSISKNETCSHMKQAILDLINELETGEY